MNNQSNTIPRITGLLIVEVRNSNPNGDPDRESDPRTRSHDGKGIISDVSFKRKLRELVLQKEGPVWKHLKDLMSLNEKEFCIHVDQETRKQEKENRESGKKNLAAGFWDVRVFGSTDLEEKDNFIRTGVVQFGLGVSSAKVRIQRDTNTVKANVDSKREDVTRGMAPLAFRVVEHGVYAMPFLINPSAADKCGCQLRDLELLCRLIPYAYSHTASRIRPFVEIRHAWVFEHANALGSASDFAILDMLTPTKDDDSIPSSSWGEYQYNGEEKKKEIESKFKGKFKHFGDLCDEEFVKKLFS